MSSKSSPRPRSSRRKRIPDSVKLDAALARFGLRRDQVQFDHNPALELRPWNPLTNDTIPPANDPNYIDMLLIEEHKIKTFGPGGEKRITTAGSDINKIRKVNRLRDAEKEFRQKLLTKGENDQGNEPKAKKPKAKMPSRPFPKRGKRK